MGPAREQELANPYISYQLCEWLLLNDTLVDGDSQEAKDSDKGSCQQSYR